jgi:hypothetical protein
MTRVTRSVWTIFWIGLVAGTLDWTASRDFNQERARRGLAQMLNHAALQRWLGANFTAGRGRAREGGRGRDRDLGTLHLGNIINAPAFATLRLGKLAGA